MSDLVVRTKLARYLDARAQMNLAKKQMEDVKEELKPYLDKARENAAGSKVLDLETKVNGPDLKEYSALQYTRKVKRVVNEERVLEFLRTKQNSQSEEDAGWDDWVSNSGVIITTEHVDQYVLWDAFVNDMITQEELDSFFSETVTWAFTPIAE